MKNMISLSLVILGLNFINPSVYAQIDPEFSGLVKNHKDCTERRYIELDNGNILYIRNYYQLYRLTLYSSDLELLAEAKIKMGDRMRFWGVEKLGEKVYFHYNILDNSTETFSGVLKEINFPNLTLGEEIVIETIPKAVYKDKKNKFHGLIYLEFKSDTLVVNTDNYATQEFKVVTFDKNLKKIDQKEISVASYGFEYVSVVPKGYSEEGEYYYKVYLSHDGGPWERTFFLYQSNDGETWVEDIEKNEPDYSGLTNMPESVYKTPGAGEYYLMGYFTYDNQTFSECFHSYNLDESGGEVERQYIHCFDKEWAWSFSNKEMLDKYNKAVAKGKEPPKLNFIMQSAITYIDGSVTYFLDQDYDLLETNNNIFVDESSIYLIHHFGNIMALHYDLDGELEWKTMITKDQIGSINQGQLSFKTKKMEDESVLIVFTNTVDKRMREIKAFSITSNNDLEMVLAYQIPKNINSVQLGIKGDSETFFYMMVKDNGDEGLFRFPIQ